MEAGTSDAAGKRTTLIVTAIAAFVGSFMSSAVNVALPTIGVELQAEAVMLSWVATSISLSQAIIMIPAGRLADIIGRKKLLIFSSLIFSVSSFLCGISGTVTLMIIFRFFQGMSAGVTIVTAVAVLTSVFPPKERGQALGINVGATYTGLALGPVLGGVMTQHLGWRSIFFLSALLCLIVAVLASRSLKREWAEARGDKFDTAGTGVFVVGLLLMMYGFTELPNTMGYLLLIAGALILMFFIWWESRTESPILDIGVFRRNTLFIFSNLATLINYLAAFATGYLLSLYLQYIKGFSAQAAGFILIAQPAIMTICSPLAGRLSDRVNPKIIAAGGMAATFIALLIFSFISETTPLWITIATLGISGLGFGLFSSPNTNAIMSSVDKKLLGVASGVLATMRTSGMTLSMGIVMILSSINQIADVQITPEYYPAFLVTVQTGFMIYAALCFVGIFAQLAGGRVKAA